MTDHGPLIPIYNTVLNTRKRREVQSDKIIEWPKHFYNHHQSSTTDILIWIEKNTQGRFYLTPLVVGFEDERDFIMFKLGCRLD